MRVLTVGIVRNQQIQSYLKSRASGISQWIGYGV